MTQETDTTITPKYLTHEDLNGALTAQKRDFQKLIDKMADQNKELVSALKQALGPKEEPLTKTEINDQRYKELKEQNDLLARKLTERETHEKLFQKKEAVRQAFNKNGIVSKAEIALKYLDDQIFYDEEGQLKMKVDGIDTKLSDAVAKFVQTDEGKFLCDPRDVRGSGGQPSGNPSKLYSPQTVPSPITGEAPVFQDAKAMKEYAMRSLEKTNIVR